MVQLQKIEMRQFKPEDRMFTKWSDWTTCSKQCTSRRQRYCKKPGTCSQNPDVQMAYCYQERTACHKWIQTMLDKKSQQRTYIYGKVIKHYFLHYITLVIFYYAETESNKIKTRRRPRKHRKCGIAYRSMTKIMGGHVAKKAKWPWHVAILNWNRVSKLHY